MVVVANRIDSFEIPTATPEDVAARVATDKVVTPASLSGLQPLLEVGDFATAAQGAKADTALQAADLSSVAFSGEYSDLAGKPALGSASAMAASAFATAAQGVKADAVFPCDKVADISPAEIPVGIKTIEVAGFYAPGDGGGGKYVRLASAPSPVELWHRQDSGGAWWALAVPHPDSVSVRAFGARINGTSDDAAAINAAIRFGTIKGIRVFQPGGISAVGATIVLPSNSYWFGIDHWSKLFRLAGHDGALVKSANFDVLTGTSDAFASNVPVNICVDGIIFDGNYQNAARTAYVQSTGEGVRLFARKIKFRGKVFNTPGVGYWSECPGGNGPTPLRPGFCRETEINLYVHSTQHEGIIWKGPGDTFCGPIIQCDAGSRIVAEESNGKVVSPNYGAVNGGQCDGIVIDGIGAEFIGGIHMFGNRAGKCLDWRGGRINAPLIIAETSHYGCVSISGTSFGSVSSFDIHRAGGFGTDATEDFIYTSSGNDNYGLTVGVMNIYRNNAAYTTARNATRIDGDFLNIGTLKIEMDNMAGHGLVINYDTAQWINIGNIDIARCKGTAPGGGESAAIHRNGTGNGTSIVIGSGLVRDCDIALKSTGAPRVESINFNFVLVTGQTPFSGTAAANSGQRWNIHGTVNGAYSTV